MSHTYAPAPATSQSPTHATTPAPHHGTRTHTRKWLMPPDSCIVWQAPIMSPTNAELIHGYTKLGQHILCPWCAHHTHTHTRGIVWWAPPVSPAKCQSR
ncbi:hypothetical protein O181_015358 [Austropuccinia psidii MF-1]|uniref:Uncharacterized protein n=1 Tax=Austropuccinia psidii MF-1 TaxID=1389203 RepID=A0A9Q3GPX3_9BASI|nr:hypothetical protein [Austropuccinia psidii MF-1]